MAAVRMILQCNENQSEGKNWQQKGLQMELRPSLSRIRYDWRICIQWTRSDTMKIHSPFNSCKLCSCLALIGCAYRDLEKVSVLLEFVLTIAVSIGESMLYI